MTYLVNTAVIPQDFAGTLQVRQITWDEFCMMAVGATSAIGHQATADALTTLGLSVTVSRVQISSLQVGDRLLVWQPKQRLPEGVVLTALQLLEIGCICRVIEVLEVAQ